MKRRLRTNADAMRKLNKASELLKRHPEADVQILQAELPDGCEAQFEYPYIGETGTIVIPVRL